MLNRRLKRNMEERMEQKLLRHVVMLKFKDDASREGIEAVEKAFVALKDSIPEIRSMEWGTDVSPEGISQGFTHLFLVTFESDRDRDAYLPHPGHKAFGDVLKPVIDKVMVMDYWTRG